MELCSSHIGFLWSLKICFFSSMLFQNFYPLRHLFFLPSCMPCYWCIQLHSSSHSLNSSAPELLFGSFPHNFYFFGKELIMFIHFIPEFIEFLSEFSCSSLNFFKTIILNSFSIRSQYACLRAQLLENYNFLFVMSYFLDFKYSL